jgi:pimeloyl-ACP methyl ester carboxylesterase
MVVRARTVPANELEFGLLEAGTGPLALCLHGFPDSAHTWQHLLPALADAGFHAVAPFMRGYAPTAVPDDGCFGIGALVADASLGFDGAEVLARAKESLRQPANLTAAISYYRDSVMAPPGEVVPDAAEAQAGRPTLYLHGSADGCIGAELVGGAERLLPLGSRMTVVQGAGHFLHLEKPAEVNGHILSWVTA